MEILKYEDGELIIPINVRKQLELFEKSKIEYDLLKQQIQQDMEEALKENNIDSLEKENISIVYKKPSLRRSLDIKKVQLEFPEVYKKYLKETNVKGGFQIKVKI